MAAEAEAARRVFIADDDDVVRSMLRSILKDNGLALIGEATDGKQALADCKRLKPDVIFLDIEMPEMKGLEVLSKIRRELPGCVMLLISAFATAQNVRGAMQLGADGIIPKPFTRDTVSGEIRRVYAKRKFKSY